MNIWYSALQLAVENSLPTAKNGTIRPETASQWLVAKGREGTLFKTVELEWSGLLEWLALQTAKISKDELLEFVRSNGVRVEETVLGLDNNSSNMKKLADAGYTFGLGMDGDAYLYDKDGNVVDTESDLTEDLDIAYQNITGQVESETKFEKYSLPGGSNYKELLLTLSAREADYVAPEDMKVLPDGYETIFDSSQPEGQRWAVIPPGQVHARPYAGRHPAPERAREYALAVLNSERDNNARDKYREEQSANTYRSNHFDQPNILTHVRFDERTDADGNRVLFINEIQSDWGQQGKRQGFSEKYRPEDVTAIEPTEAEGGQPKLFWYFEVPGNVLQIPKSRYATQAEARQYILNEKSTRNGAPPKAPFVTKTDAWVALAIKRMARYAAENGFDKVAFINGEQAAGLYDLSKQIDRVDYNQTEDGLYNLSAIRGKSEVFSKEYMTEDELEGVIGKEVANKIIKGEGRPVDGHYTLSGIDLKVGGKGMRAFYDNIVPNVAKDVLKKVGGKPENFRLSGTDYYDQLLETGMPVAECKEIADSMMPEQTGFTITPEMRAQVMQGFPLFRLLDSDRVGLEPISSDVITEELTRIVEAWPGTPEVIIVQTAEDLPFTAPDHAQAVTYDDKIYLVVANISEVKDIQLAIGHEAIGHIAFAQLFDDERELGEYLHGVMEAAKKEGTKLNSLLQEIEEKYSYASDEVKAKELVSLAVERSLDADGNLDIELSFLKSLYSKTANLIRAIGLDIPFSNFELQGLIVDAGRLITHPVPPSKTFQSLNELGSSAAGSLSLPDREVGSYRGTVSQTTPLHAVQELGRGLSVVHDKRDLPKGIKKGDKLAIKYENKKAVTLNTGRAVENSLAH